ncbi:Methylated-DNA--protein-cysteine methyltransferase [Delftia tsuruhatensis]|uniref:methylated-DNA--[protein]-cysteine S-methyltransferase n=1 Tax=Delftia tsuruhatensis TaxID=180282 RepID=UPI001E807E4E|nr:methylated-DNA--[protein]-cysteine S-methyltransferase [Delftia tsuruhatensis]CAB5720358.1 Methylated-DNA--protein-cysteine methyltransferase [Delftia tsuruhatensis]CAC9685754.1 Methylated-DNA--protein-cysteine methyltransferase [Delftia tsuruhatensis]
MNQDMPGASAARNPEPTGHALFATRVGPCGVAWGPGGLVAFQLPEVDGPAATRTRMLRGVQLRRPGSYAPAARAQDLPDNVVQAIAGVQVLMAGYGEWSEQPPPAAGARQLRDGPVLPDLRSRRAPHADDALPDLAELALDWHGVSEFHCRVYALTRAIAPGHTRTYGEIARELGEVGLSRAVGQALGLNPFAPVIPCHRVLAAGSRPGGFSGGGGALTKLRMLEIEGAAWGGTRSLFGD